MTEGAERPESEAPASAASPAPAGSATSAPAAPAPEAAVASASGAASAAPASPAAEPAAQPAPAGTPGPSTPAPAAHGPDEALARSEREAREALETGAFERGNDTVRIQALTQDATAPAAATPAPATPATPAPATPASAAPAPEPAPAEPAALSPLAAIKRAAEAAVSTETPTPADGTPANGAAPATVPEAAPPAAPQASPAVAATASEPAAAEPVITVVVTSPTAADADAGATTEKFDRRAVHADVARPAAPAAEPPREASARKSGRLQAPRTEEDDRLLGALIFLDPPMAGPEKPPSPFETIAGVTLLKRAAAAAKAALVPRVILAGVYEPPTLEKAREEFAKAGYSGPLETWAIGTAMPLGPRGRVLILDAAGVHDPEAVARLARWKGERACVLAAEEGDGLRVQVENGKVREVGTSLVPFDGVTCGAVNVPMTLFHRLTELGAMGALQSLARDELLAATLERRTFAREITSETSLGEARQRLLERASGGSGDAFLNRVLHRKLSRPLTAMLLPMGIPPMLLTAGSGIVGLLGAALLSGCGLAPSPIILWVGIVLLFGSIILDCAGDELAALGMRDSPLRRKLGVALAGAVSVAAVLGLGAGAQLLNLGNGTSLGLIAAVGVGISAVLAMIVGRGDSQATDTVSYGAELLAARIRNRDITYLLLAVVLAHTIQQALATPPPEDAIPDGPPVLLVALIGLAAFANSFAVALAVLLAFRPRSES